MGLIPFAASSISPFESFELDESVLPPIVETIGGAGPSNLKGATGKRTSARRTTRSSVIGNSNGEVEDEGSMRVMYEDPSVDEERRKLMKLLKSGEQESFFSKSKDVEVPEEPLKRGRRTRKNLRA